MRLDHFILKLLFPDFNHSRASIERFPEASTQIARVQYYKQFEHTEDIVLRYISSSEWYTGGMRGKEGEIYCNQTRPGDNTDQ